MADSQQHATQVPPMQEPIEQNRATFIQTLYQEYKRQLHHLLQVTAMDAVGLHKGLDMVAGADAVRSVLHLDLRWSADAVEESRPASTSIIQAYEDAGQHLLMLGETGAGKTTLLLELASELLTRAEGDPTLPIPVILNLSSWTNQQSSLESWLIDQLQLVYHVPSRISRMWLEQKSWLLLLDGLDEVEESSRPACIEAINAYQAQDPAMPLAVTSYSHEYLAQESQLALVHTVIIQPLREPQVMECLDQLGESVAGVREALCDNPVLRGLVTNPLMLQMTILAYRDETNIDLPQSLSSEELQQAILDRYVERALGQRAAREHYTPQQTRYWLGWLAGQMKERHLTEFYLERLQPSWLATDRSVTQYRLFYMLAYGLVGALAYGLVGGLVYGLMGRLIYGLVVGLILGLVVGVAGGLLDDIKQIRPVEVLTWSWKGVWREPVAGSRDGKKIRLALTWSWNRIWQGLVVGIVVGLISWLIVGLIPAVIIGLIGGLIGWLIIDLLGGLTGRLVFELVNGASGQQVSKDGQMRPNQAIRDSGSKAVCIGLVGGLAVALIVGLIGARAIGLEQMVVLVVFLAVFSGVLIAQAVGGRAYVCHYILRYILYRNGAMPWQYIRFLDEATRRNILQRVGGGHRFVHPLLMDYFASIAAGPRHSCSGRGQVVNANANAG
jgi:hypothetical protein